MTESIDAYNVPRRVESYDADMELMHPNRVKMVDAALRFLPLDRSTPVTALDLGTGTGLFARRFLEDFPRGSVIAIDGASSMVELARMRLAPFGTRADLREGDFSDLRAVVSVWERGQVALSAFALHHLAREDKERLFSQIHAFLEPGGWLVNADLIASEHAAVEARLLELRIQGITSRAAGRDARFKDRKTTEAFLEHLSSTEKDHVLPLKGDLDALSRAGFHNVAVVWLEYDEAVIVGQK